MHGVILLQADDPKQAAKDILARAAARGIISGVPTVDKKGGKNKKAAKKNKAADKNTEKGKKKEKEKDDKKSSAKSKSGKVSSMQRRRLKRRPPSEPVTLARSPTPTSTTAQTSTWGFKPSLPDRIYSRRMSNTLMSPPVTVHTHMFDISNVNARINLTSRKMSGTFTGRFVCMKCTFLFYAVLLQYYCIVLLICFSNLNFTLLLNRLNVSA